MKTNVTLSTGQVVEVRRLGLFELQDNLPQPVIEPYTVTVLFASGKVYQQLYDLSKTKEKPEIAEELCDRSMAEYWAWDEYHKYQKGLRYEQERIENYVKYCQDVAQYIRDYAVGGELLDCHPEDWALIIESALIHLVASEDIKKALQEFNATYDQRPLWDVYEAMVDDSLGSYDMRVVELKRAETLNLSLEDYFSRSVEIRAREIAAERVPDMIAAVEQAYAVRNSGR